MMKTVYITEDNTQFTNKNMVDVNRLTKLLVQAVINHGLLFQIKK